MKFMTAQINVNGVVHYLRYDYLVLWTGDDYELTIFQVHDEGTAEFINRVVGLQSLLMVECHVQQALRRDLLNTVHGDIVYE